MSLRGEEDTTSLIFKWTHCYQEEKIMVSEYQETLMGDVLNLQAIIERGGRDEKI